MKLKDFLNEALNIGDNIEYDDNGKTIIGKINGFKNGKKEVVIITSDFKRTMRNASEIRKVK